MQISILLFWNTLKIYTRNDIPYIKHISFEYLIDGSKQEQMFFSFFFQIVSWLPINNWSITETQNHSQASFNSVEVYVPNQLVYILKKHPFMKIQVLTLHIIYLLINWQSILYISFYFLHFWNMHFVFDKRQH